MMTRVVALADPTVLRSKEARCRSKLEFAEVRASSIFFFLLTGIAVYQLAMMSVVFLRIRVLCVL